MAPRPKKDCPICGIAVSSFKESPALCKARHSTSERACLECWEDYLSNEVEEKRAEDIKCMFPHDKHYTIDRDELDRLASKETLARYDMKIKEANAVDHCRCQARCWASKRDTRERNSPTVLQPHNRKEDGRVFTCKFCDFKTCIDCDRPEHDKETCEQYRTRVIDQPHHVRDEAATEQQSKHCPGCHVAWEWHPRGKKCGYTSCDVCKFRFCGSCLVPWIGAGGAYDLGKMAHGGDCRYRTRPSGHGLKKKHNWEGEKQARAVAKDQAKRAETGTKRKAQKLDETDAGVVEGGFFDAIKKRKLVAKG